MPFTLTHPKPQPQLEQSKSESTSQVKEEKSDGTVNNGNDQTVPVDLNLIEFETNVTNGNKYFISVYLAHSYLNNIQLFINLIIIEVVNI